LRTEGFIKLFSIKAIVVIILSIILFQGTLCGLEKYLKLGIGTGWKNNLNPVYSFSSASDIFNRRETEGGMLFLFGTEGGLGSSKEKGFSVDASISGELSLSSMENSKLDSLLSGGYFFPVNENNLTKLSLSLHNSTINFNDPQSLYIDSTLALSHIYYSDSIYSLFFRLSSSWYKSTSDLLNYLNGLFLSLDSSGRVIVSDYFYIEGLSAVSLSFFNDQVVEYHRHNDVYYGQLEIEGRFYSFSKGIVLGFDIGRFSVPASFRYFYSRSFSSDIHRIMFWNDLERKPLVHRKTRADHTIEMNLRALYYFTDNFVTSISYLGHRNFSNVGEHYADYGDFGRIIHSFIVEISYEF